MLRTGRPQMLRAAIGGRDLGPLEPEERTDRQCQPARPGPRHPRPARAAAGTVEFPYPIGRNSSLKAGDRRDPPISSRQAFAGDIMRVHLLGLLLHRRRRGAGARPAGRAGRPPARPDRAAIARRPAPGLPGRQRPVRRARDRRRGPPAAGPARPAATPCRASPRGSTRSRRSCARSPARSRSRASAPARSRSRSPGCAPTSRQRLERIEAPAVARAAARSRAPAARRRGAAGGRTAPGSGGAGRRRRGSL